MDQSPPSFVSPSSYSTQPPGTNGVNQYNTGYTTQPGVAPYYSPQYYNYPPMQQQQQQQQQQTSVVVLGQQQYVAVKPAMSFVGPIVLSIFAIFCSGLFGIIALVLAIVGYSMTGSERTARQLHHASIGLSIAGIITGVVIIIVVPAVVISLAVQTPYNYYY